jgi:uncharacterized membrane protein
LKHSRAGVVRVVTAIAASVIALGGPFGGQTALTHERSGRYFVIDLEPLGSGVAEGRHVSNKGVVSGLSDIDGPFRRATVWAKGRPIDLGTLGGPHSAVVFGDWGHPRLIVGVSETDVADERREVFSCSAFFPGGLTGFTCRGFVVDGRRMKALDTLGGPYSFAAGANARGEVVGWAQTTFEDNTCASGTIHQFLPVIWNARTGRVKTTLATYGSDTAGAAVAINNRGQVAGISGDCDQAVGRHSARHAVIWKEGVPTDIGNLGADSWNTPVSINERGDVAGFAGLPNGDQPVENFAAFYWTEEIGIQQLPALGSDAHSEAWAINNRRQVVGLSCGEAVCTAMLWEKGRAVDLNTLVQPGYRGHLRTARHINEAGMITGQTEDESGRRRAFLAVPVR